jgi:hypothetical protein
MPMMLPGNHYYTVSGGKYDEFLQEHFTGIKAGFKVLVFANSSD